MCLAAYLSPGAKLTKEQIETAWYNNSDGAGWGWAKEGRLYVQRFSLLNAFRDNFLEWQAQNDWPCIVHFRYATHGSTEKLNIHPFFVHDDLLMCHNGVLGISSHAEGDKDKSDTRIFNEYVLGSLPHNFFRNYGTMWLLESAIGTDKMIFLHSSGEHAIANEENGHWSKDKGIWFSNHSYEEKRSYLPTMFNKSYASKYYSEKAGSNVAGTHPYLVPRYEKCELCDHFFNTEEEGQFQELKSRNLLPDWASDEEFICDDCFEEYESYYREKEAEMQDLPPMDEAI